MRPAAVPADRVPGTEAPATEAPATEARVPVVVPRASAEGPAVADTATAASVVPNGGAATPIIGPVGSSGAISDVNATALNATVLDTAAVSDRFRRERHAVIPAIPVVVDQGRGRVLGARRAIWGQSRSFPGREVGRLRGRA